MAHFLRHPMAKSHEFIKNSIQGVLDCAKGGVHRFCRRRTDLSSSIDQERPHSCQIAFLPFKRDPDTCQPFTVLGHQRRSFSLFV